MPSLWFKRKNCPGVDEGRFGRPIVSIAEAKPHQLEKRPPCQALCPSGNDVRGWVGLVAQRGKLGLSPEAALRQAWYRLVETNPFPATLGRVCPHPCQSECNREAKEGALQVHALERFLGDWAIDQKLRLRPLTAETHSERIGVLGAGPSGLSFAYQMARRGYPVTVYEKREKPGGMLRWGIPDYRLPPETLDAEIDRIVALGIDLRCGVAIGTRTSMAEIQAAHDLLYLGIGAQSGRRLRIEGEEGPGHWTGTDFLERLHRGQSVPLGNRVAVIGGGNTAIDAARMARRLGAEVTLLYRRTRQEMPAIASEVDEALKEGVRIEFLVAPLRISRQGDRITSLTVQAMELGDADASGRRRPVPVDGATRLLPIDSVIAAVAQEPDWSGLEALEPSTTWAPIEAEGLLGPGLWAGGDVTGPGLATIAIAQGRRAAEAAHATLTGRPLPPADRREPIRSSRLRLDFYPVAPAVEIPRRPEAEWLTEPTREITQTLSEAEFLREVSRCLSCGLCFGCDRCWMYCNPSGFAPRPSRAPGEYYTMLTERCEGCGKCAEICPSGYLSRPSEDGSIPVESADGRSRPASIHRQRSD